jgi:hypothetical protein
MIYERAKVRHGDPEHPTCLQGVMAVGQESDPFGKREVFKDMLAVDEGDPASGGREATPEVEADIGTDFPVKVNVHPTVETVLTTAEVEPSSSGQGQQPSMGSLPSKEAPPRLRGCRNVPSDGRCPEP